MSTKEAIEKSRELPCKNQTYFSKNTGVNSHLTLLYDRMLSGELDVQVTIDSFIMIELLLQHQPTAKRLLALQHEDIVNSMRTPLCHTVHSDTLPDLGMHIRAVVYFSGNSPPQPHLPDSLVYSLIYEALPNIKRTKQMKNYENPRNSHMCAPLTSACINVMLGTLLGLFDNSAKQPNFPKRCKIVAEIHRATCMSDTEKQEWMHTIPNILKLSFMEYVMWFIKSFMPVEHNIIHKRASTDIYSKTYSAVCDSFRQSMMETDASIQELDCIAAQNIDRCMRMCKFKMYRHTQKPITASVCVNTISQNMLEIAMNSSLLLKPHTYKTPKNKGKMVNVFDNTKELSLLNPMQSAELLSLTNQVHQTITVSPLPKNVAELQWNTLCRQFRNCAHRLQMARSVHLCIVCCMSNKPLSNQKFRMDTSNDTLQCTTCKNNWSVKQIDIMGFVMYYSSQAMFLCVHCGKLINHTGGIKGWLSCCQRWEPPPRPKRQTNRKPKHVCIRCDSSNIYHTTTLFNRQLRSMQTVHLCFTHTPTPSIRQYITSVEELV